MTDTLLQLDETTVFLPDDDMLARLDALSGEGTPVPAEASDVSPACRPVRKRKKDSGSEAGSAPDSHGPQAAATRTTGDVPESTHGTTATKEPPMSVKKTSAPTDAPSLEWTSLSFRDPAAIAAFAKSLGLTAVGEKSLTTAIKDEGYLGQSVEIADITDTFEQIGYDARLTGVVRSAADVPERDRLAGARPSERAFSFLPNVRQRVLLVSGSKHSTLDAPNRFGSMYGAVPVVNVVFPETAPGGILDGATLPAYRPSLRLIAYHITDDTAVDPLGKREVLFQGKIRGASSFSEQMPYFVWEAALTAGATYEQLHVRVRTLAERLAEKSAKAQFGRGRRRPTEAPNLGAGAGAESSVPGLSNALADRMLAAAGRR